MQIWAEAVIRQAERTRAVIIKDETDSRAYDYNDGWGVPNEHDLAANFRMRWAEEHMLVWSVYQLEQWRARLAKERGEPKPQQNQNLMHVRHALEHLNAASLEEEGATAPSETGWEGRSLRELPGKMLHFTVGGEKLFEVLDPHRLYREALKVVESIASELDAEAQAAYEALLEP